MWFCHLYPKYSMKASTELACQPTIYLSFFCTSLSLPSLNPQPLTLFAHLAYYFFTLIEQPRTPQYEFPPIFLATFPTSVTNPTRNWAELQNGNICCHILILQNSYTLIFGICLFSAVSKPRICISLANSCIMKNWITKK